MAGLVVATGMSWSECERDMDVRRLAALQREFQSRPPVQAMVQAYLGIETASGPPPVDQSDDEIEAEFAALARRGLIG